MATIAYHTSAALEDALSRRHISPEAPRAKRRARSARGSRQHPDALAYLIQDTHTASADEACIDTQSQSRHHGSGHPFSPAARRLKRAPTPPPPRNRRLMRRHHAAPALHTDDTEESLRLARSDLPLPSDHSVRPLSLEREEAFRDPRTVKKPSQYARARAAAAEHEAAAAAATTGPEDMDAAQVAELYSLGVLYDNEHMRGSGFNLNTIAHAQAQPEYTVALRPTARDRKRQQQQHNHQRHNHLYPGGAPVHLPADWSFGALEEDDELARYLAQGGSGGGDASKAAPGTDGSRRGYRMVWRAPATAAAEPAGEAGETPMEPPKKTGSSTKSTKRGGQVIEHKPKPQAAIAGDRGDIENNDDDDESEWDFLPAKLTREPEDIDATEEEDAATTGAWVVLGDGL